MGGASPLARVHAGAPPSFVIHGTFDSLSPVGQARAFVSALRAAGAPVADAELPAAQHAFDRSTAWVRPTSWTAWPAGSPRSTSGT